jgi:oligopeptide/dipeptide ABC transporter ATP-binding protein
MLELLKDAQSQFGMSMILIAHDLGVVAGICDRVAVMYAGRIVEQAETHELFRAARHPYTAALIGATPRLDRVRGARLLAIPGSLAVGSAAADMCSFAPRCARATAACAAKRPPLEPSDASGTFACWHPLGEAFSASGIETNA